jgi:hypothetical protein
MYAHTDIQIPLFSSLGFTLQDLSITNFIACYLSYRVSKSRYPLLGTDLVDFQLYMGHLYHFRQKHGLVIVFICRLSMAQGDAYGCQVYKGRL